MESKHQASLDDTLRVTRAAKQYLYIENGEEYLDCLNGNAHIGHSHPQVVSSAQNQVAKLATTQGFVCDLLTQFVKQLASTMPEELSVVYLCNNGVEANDLALLLAREYTGNKDVVTLEGAYHGYLSGLVDISPKLFNLPNVDGPKDYVHVVPLPDMYRGPYCLKQSKRMVGLHTGSLSTSKSEGAETHQNILSSSCDEDKMHSLEVRAIPPSSHSPSERSNEEEILADQYADVAENTIKTAKQLGRKGIAAFICEPFLVVPGLHILPQNYFERVYGAVRENGGVCIADENHTGLGRIGTHDWAFQKIGIIPDIVTTGTSIGNGHPVAAVVCKREISAKLRGYFSTFGGNPVACSVGLAVLRVLKNEKLKSSANNVGRIIASLLSNIMNKYSEKVGDIRGQGLIWALEIVKDKSKVADPKFARKIIDLMRTEEKILLGLTGMKNNILLFTPPLCFTVDNSRRFVKSLDNSIGNALPSKILDRVLSAEPSHKMTE